MTRKIMVLALCSLLLAACSTAQAQQRPKLSRIGFITNTGSEQGGMEAFRKGCTFSVTMKAKHTS
jgi:hypothetical protein